MSRSKSWARGAALSVAALVIGLGLAACGGGDGGGGPKVALLLPECRRRSARRARVVWIRFGDGRHLADPAGFAAMLRPETLEKLRALSTKISDAQR